MTIKRGGSVLVSAEMEGDSISAILNPQCIGFLRKRSKVKALLPGMIFQKLGTDFLVGLACTFYTNGQSEVNRESRS